MAEGKAASVDTVERALSAVLEAEAARCVDLWEGLTAHQRLVLLAVALDEGVGLYREEMRRRHHLGPAARIQKTVQRLLERELVEPVAGAAYRVADVFFRQWLRRLPQVRF